ncbi:hypothetical protein MAH1_25710 [Sessilibacter sp. MAH1]
MKVINRKDICNLYQWMEFIVNVKDTYVDDTNCHLKIFDDQDSSYLVINIYNNNTTATEYYFKPESSKNYLYSLISCLKEFNFSLEVLLESLSELEFTDDDTGYFSTINDIQMFKETIVSN